VSSFLVHAVNMVNVTAAAVTSEPTRSMFIPFISAPILPKISCRTCHPYWYYDCVVYSSIVVDEPKDVGSIQHV